MFCPVIHFESSSTRNKMIFAMSSGSPIRLKADIEAKRFITSSFFPYLKSSVLTGPGEIEFTVIPLFPTSFANTLVSCSTADLVAEYVP
jgi:hypothetical protein